MSTSPGVTAWPSTPSPSLRTCLTGAGTVKPLTKAASAVSEETVPLAATPLPSASTGLTGLKPASMPVSSTL